MMFPKGFFVGILLLSSLCLPLRAQVGEAVAGEREADNSSGEIVSDTTSDRLPVELGGVEEVTVVADSSGDASSANVHSPPPFDTASKKEEYPRYTLDEYRYAKAPRYTLTGDLPYRDTHVRPVPAVLTGLGVAGIVAAIHIYQQNAWWSDRREPFHFTVDWGYAAQADKFGHFFAGYMSSYTGYEALVSSGFSPDVAGWMGPLIGLSFQTYVEIEDGFSPFGFDPTDQYANTIGPLFFGLQHYFPDLQNFKFKWSYFPNDEYQGGVRSGHDEIIVDDYNGQTIWFSTKVANLLPESIAWPKWLRLAFGYGTYNVDRINERNEVLVPGRRYFISLDYDLVEMLPDLGDFGNWLLQTADYLHWPAPALQLAPEVKFYLAWPVHF
ncbi:MAG: DUF2279 domain-containing protein [Ignavibacteriae bacterium]|nr:DUF2279 domain-containing protein [Ignavibacteriota bacterium]MCB9217651.1 DUF2279 domain-containing protein [Ignavibacteria bacterium]